jgi:hypothetical protein
MRLKIGGKVKFFTGKKGIFNDNRPDFFQKQSIYTLSNIRYKERQSEYCNTFPVFFNRPENSLGCKKQITIFAHAKRIRV